MQAEADPDRKFAAALLQEALEAVFEGDPETGRVILRELVNSTIGFEILAEELDKPSKSIHRMLSARGNPTMDNLASILVALQKRLGTDLKASLLSHDKTPRRTAKRRPA